MALPTGNIEKLLLVEGADDSNVCWAFVKDHPWRPVVTSEGGYETLRSRLPAHLLRSGLTALGVVVDADESLGARWQSMVAAFASSGINLPEAPDPKGTIIETDALRVGVWVMPNNSLDGMLEDFIQILVPEGDNLLGYASVIVDSLVGNQRKFRDAHKAKARIHTWLAWQEEPGRPMGQAITKRFLDKNCALAGTFADWLKRLFG